MAHAPVCKIKKPSTTCIFTSSIFFEGGYGYGL
jgi:hypothetical protein